MQNQRLPFNPPGKKLGNYRFQNEIGRGNYGVVYLAQDEKGERYAIKCLKKEIFNENGGIIGDLIRNEKNALLQVKDKNVIRMYEYIESVNQAYMIFELCDSGHFELFLQGKQFKISIYEAIQYFKQIVSGVRALHEKRIIHRDLKLSNILMKDQANIKIADLGFCHILSENENLVKLNLGTIGTKAPEIIQGKPYGLLVDMFSAGVIFYQLLCCGFFPFQPTTEAEYLEEIKKGSDRINFSMINKKIPEKLQQLVKSMLQFEPDQRLKWSELYAHQLFAPESPELIMETYLGYSSRMDPEQLRKFYEQNQENLKSMVSPKFQNETCSFYQYANGFTPSTTDKTHQDQSDYVDISFNNDNTILPSIIISEKNQLFEKYLAKQRYITLHFRLYDLIHKTKFTSVRQSLFPLMLLSKKIFQLNIELLKITDSKENIFNSPLFPELIESQEWQYFKNDLNNKKQQIYDQLLHQQNTVKKNLHQLSDKINKDWEIECDTYYPSPEFPRIFHMAIDNYTNFVMMDVHQSNPKSLNCINKQICFLYLIACLTDKAYFNYEDEYYSVEQLQFNEQLTNIYEKVCQAYFQH